MLERIKQLFNKKQLPDNTIEEKIEELFEETFSTDIIKFEVGSDIVDLEKDICSEIGEFREKIALKYGFIFPTVHVIQRSDLQENEIKIFVREKEVINDFLIPNSENILKEVNKNLEFIYKEYLDDIFSNEFIEKIINRTQLENSWLIWNISCRYTITEIKKVFLNILKQKKSIKNTAYILEKIGELSIAVSSETLSKIIIEELS